MKRIKQYFCFLVVITVMVNSTGCFGSKSPGSSALAIVLGAHGNAKAANLSDSKVTQIIESTIKDNGFVSAVIADGTPELAATNKFKSEYIFPTPWGKNKEARNGRSQIINFLSTSKADHEELDTLKSLDMACRSFASLPKDTNKQILVIDTGLSTTGLMSFNNTNLIYADPDMAISYLTELKAIPDFTGIEITWMGLGDVAYPQKDLSPKQKDLLRNIWRKVIEAGGGNVLFIDTPQGKDVNAEDYPKVSPVEMPSELMPSFDAKQPVVWYKDEIAFIGDTAKYIDNSRAQKTLQPIAEYMINNSNFNALIVGTTAHGDDRSFCINLSYNRALAVKKTLIEMGVSSSQIVIMGMGYEDPWHVSPDRRSNGTYIKNIAEKNRKVVLLDANSTEATILKGTRTFPLN